MKITNIDVGGSAQAAILLARKGQFLPSDPHYVSLPVLYHIVFHSLGSRIYKIREKTGLFYGAMGMLGNNATVNHPGMDLIGTKVEPTDVQRALQELHNLLTKLGSNPEITHKELTAAKSWYEHKIVETLMSPELFAGLIVQYKHLYPGHNYRDLLMNHVDQINKLTIDEVNTLAKNVFKAPYDLTIVAR